jgi:hypothetical protein
LLLLLVVSADVSVDVITDASLALLSLLAAVEDTMHKQRTNSVSNARDTNRSTALTLSCSAISCYMYRQLNSTTLRGARSRIL